MAVARPVDGDGGEELMAVTLSRDTLAEAPGERDGRDHPRHRAAQHRHVDARALARRRAAVESLHDLAVAVLGGPQIDHRQAEDRGRSPGVARQLHEAGTRLEHGIVGRLVVVTAEPGDAEPDQV